MVLMDLNEQADWDFSRARRKGRLRRLMSRLRGEPALYDTPRSFEEVRGSLLAYNWVRRGTRVVDTEKIVGSVGRRRDFDRCFSPLRASVEERWKHVDLAFHRGEELPPVSLYKLGDTYFVLDGNHRVSVARYHGLRTVEADVTEFWPARVERREAGSAAGPETRAA
ncbi:MAG: hypothetical protein ACRDTR_13035 [Rubrobacter sp.]